MEVPQMAVLRMVVLQSLEVVPQTAVPSRILEVSKEVVAHQPSRRAQRLRVLLRSSLLMLVNWYKKRMTRKMNLNE